MQEPITPTTCNHCGKPFNTSRQHPRRYCSIACEEGRGPLPTSDPQHPNYPSHVKGNPALLVGRNLLAQGFRRTCYSPDWHRKPSEYNNRMIVEHDEENEILILKDDVFLGRVAKYEQGHYLVERDGFADRWLNSSLVVAQLRQDNWWVE